MNSDVSSGARGAASAAYSSMLIAEPSLLLQLQLLQLIVVISNTF